MEKLAFTIPYPPSANRLYRKWRGNIVLSDEGKEYKELIGWMAVGAGAEPLDGEVVVSLIVYRPRKFGDLDNRIKPVFDGLEGVCYHNDSQIVEFHAYRRDDKVNPRVEIEIYPAEESSPPNK